MSTIPNSPRLLKGGIVLLDPDTGAVRRIITLQYNPDAGSRMLQPRAIQGKRRPLGGVAVNGAGGGDHLSLMQALIRNVNCL